MHVPRCWWWREQNWKRHQARLCWRLRAAGWFLEEWQPLLAPLSGLLSRRTFLTRAAQAGLGATQLSATWQAGRNFMAGGWSLGS